MKNYVLTIFILYFSLTLFTQNGPAIINDSDGFTNVRNGPGKGYFVIDTLFNEDFFYFQLSDNSEWAKVIAWKGRQIEGYIHTSRIQEMEKLDNGTLKALITKILDRQRFLAENYQSASKSRDKPAYKTKVRELEEYSETKYEPILQIIPKYYCATNDIEIIKLLFATMWANKGSASEIPSFSIGDCFICNPDLIIEQIIKIKENEQKNLLFDHIEWGLMNHFEVEENRHSGGKEFNSLMQRIEIERKKANL